MLLVTFWSFTIVLISHKSPLSECCLKNDYNLWNMLSNRLGNHYHVAFIQHPQCWSKDQLWHIRKIRQVFSEQLLVQGFQNGNQNKKDTTRWQSKWPRISFETSGWHFIRCSSLLSLWYHLPHISTRLQGNWEMWNLKSAPNCQIFKPDSGFSCTRDKAMLSPF